jgi:hypothetical protein
MSDQKSTIREAQKTPGAPHNEPQPNASEHRTATPGQAKPGSNPPKPAWQPAGPKK